jgi:low temperature requirement protein LtrA
VLLAATWVHAWSRRRDASAPWALVAGLAGIAVGAYFVLGFFTDRERVSFHWPLFGWLVLCAAAPPVLARWRASARLAVWALALVLDMGGPLVIDTSGWRLVPHHFAERHGLIVIVALGESIVAIGVGAGDHVDAGVVVTAVAGIAVAAALWWAYFDVAAVLADRRLAEEPDVTARNELARDAYSYLHLVLVAGIVLVALGGKTALADVDEGLAWPAAAALAGGAATYLFGQVAFKRRSIGTLSLPRLAAGVVVLAVIPLAHATSGLLAVVAVAVVLWTLLGVEGVRYAEVRRRTRAELHGHSHDGG